MEKKDNKVVEEEKKREGVRVNGEGEGKERNHSCGNLQNKGISFYPHRVRRYMHSLSSNRSLGSDMFHILLLPQRWIKEQEKILNLQKRMDCELKIRKAMQSCTVHLKN